MRKLLTALEGCGERVPRRCQILCGGPQRSSTLSRLEEELHLDGWAYLVRERSGATEVLATKESFRLDLLIAPPPGEVNARCYRLAMRMSPLTDRR